MARRFAYQATLTDSKGQVNVSGEATVPNDTETHHEVNRNIARDVMREYGMGDLISGAVASQEIK